jgi:hypothetical protein
MIDPRSLSFGPNPDPVRAIVHLASPEMVELVMVDGRILVEGKQICVADEQEILSDAMRSSRQVWNSHRSYHPQGRALDDLFPPALRPWTE